MEDLLEVVKITPNELVLKIKITPRIYIKKTIIGSNFIYFGPSFYCCTVIFSHDGYFEFKNGGTEFYIELSDNDIDLLASSIFEFIGDCKKLKLDNRIFYFDQFTDSTK